MNRLRLLRLLIPVALVAFVAIVVIALRDRPAGPEETGNGAVDGPHNVPRLQGFTITDIVGDRRRLAVSARVGSWNEDGGFQADGIDRIELDRDDGSPLIVSAAKGRGSGPQGRRVIQLEGGVEIRDEENGFLVKIPSAELDQGAGFARSVGQVVVASPGANGTAASAVYPLDGRPTEIYGLELSDVSGAVLKAGKVTLPRGGASAQFEGAVHLTRGADALASEQLRIERDASGAITSAEAIGAVQGAAHREGTPAVRFRAARADLDWAAGAVDHMVLSGGAKVEQGTRTLQGATLDVKRRGAGWTLVSSNDVVLTGMLTSGSSSLQAGALEADLDAAGAIERGRADGGVRFTGKDAAGDGDSAELARDGSAERVTLRSGNGRRARLAAGRTRVNADTIVTTERGTRLQAEGRVEATLLPEPRTPETASPAVAMFDSRDAIHFVATRLEVEESGKVLRLRQNVRGWQADRNISADELDVDQRIDAVDGRGRVTTRWPRETKGKAAAGFVNVSADHLRYRGREGTASYTGNVRVRQDEGWITCGRLEVMLTEAGGRLKEVHGYETVRLEFRAPPSGPSATSEPVTGFGDRLVYALDAGLVRLYGDRAPAEVQRGGPEGGTTAGRVLRYELETGQIQVESGAAGRNGSAKGSR